MFKIYKLNSEQKKMIEKLLSDDVVGRQTIIQKDGSGFNSPGSTIVVIEGPENIFGKVTEILGPGIGPVSEKEAAEIYKKIKEEEENAEGGMGFLFG
jgi:predicted oxidoreductase (fatty acid repression mutant protein)